MRRAEPDSEITPFEDLLLDNLSALLALVTAAECGLLEQLAGGPVPAAEARSPAANAALLLSLLKQGRVIGDAQGEMIAFTPEFGALWSRRGAALMARARFTLMAAQDMIAGRDAFFSDRSAFMGGARTFGFFCYGRAQGTGLANIQDTEAWAGYVTALNEREAPVLVDLVPFETARSVLEIGGNTGGFALAMLARNPRLRAVVMDLPAVCEIGRHHVQGRPGANRLRFHPGDAQRDAWPDIEGERPEMICFKSVLHDWDEAGARRMLQRAAESVRPGGTVVIVERGRIEDAPRLDPFAAVSNLVFAPFYRAPEWYEIALEEAGLHQRSRETRCLDLPFHAIVAEKPA